MAASLPYLSDTRVSSRKHDYQPLIGSKSLFTFFRDEVCIADESRSC